MAWAVQLVPALVALAWPALPLGLRLLLVAYSALALLPATAVLFSGVARLNRQEPLDLAMLRDDLGRLLLPCLRTLAPLPGLCGLLCLLIIVVAPLQFLLLDILFRLLLLILLFSAAYWGPLFVAEPEQGPGRCSGALCGWPGAIRCRQPARSCWLWLLCLSAIFRLLASS